MEITTHTVDEVTVVALSGDIDGKTAPIAQNEILPLCQKESARLALDMSGVNYMSSAGLRLMLSLYRQASAANGKLVLVGLSDEVRSTMAATGFLDYFTTSATLEDGLATLKQEG
jgi:anti-sigma B factor antagonist